MFNATTGDRPGVPDILILLTDGNQGIETKPELFPSLEAIAKKIKDRGITVITVAIGDRLNEPNLKLMATSENHIFRSASFDQVYKHIYNVSIKACESKCFSYET